MKYRPIYRMSLMACFAALLCGGFVSCSNTETDIDDTTAEVKVPLSISSATIASSTEARKASYNANSFEKGDVIGLYILSSDCESPYDTEENCYNVPATYDGSQWVISQDVYLSDDYAYVIAYYPYSESYGNVFPNANNWVTLPISIVPVDNEQNDVLTCAYFKGYNNNNSEVTLTFSHALSRITLSITVDDTLDKNADLISASLYEKSGKLVTSAQLGFSWDWFGLLESDEYFSDEYFTMSCIAALSSSTAYVVDFLIDPSTSTGLIASLVINSNSGVCDIALPSDGWNSGYQYTYNLHGTAPEAEEDEEEQITFEVLSSSYIEGWTDKGTSDEIELGGTTDEEEDSDDGEEDSDDDEGEETDGVTYVNGYAAVDLGLSVKWATCNVGADSPEDYGNYYAWGETETKDTYTSSNSVTYGVEISFDISGNAEYDAATANWGGSWRMPTFDEIVELRRNCTYEYTSLNGITGFVVTGSNGNSIFLPAAGIYVRGILQKEGERACYWSSTPYESGDDFTYETSACFFGSSPNDYSTLTSGWTTGRYHGFSIRPVTD